MLWVRGRGLGAVTPTGIADTMTTVRKTFTQEELEAHLERLRAKGVPEQDFKMRIDREGRWFHQGGEVAREALVRTLAGLLLRLDDGSHWLVNPAEYGKIDVEDAPFIASRMTVSGTGAGQVVGFTTNLGEECAIDADHPLIIRGGNRPDEPRPYIRVRGNLEARIDRQGFYDLAGQSVESDGVAGIWSAGGFFPLDGHAGTGGAA